MNVSLVADDTAFHTASRNAPTRKLLELINEFSKGARFKINMQKPVTFQYTNNELSEWESKKFPFKITSERIKYLGLNWTKEGQDLYSENEILQEIENDTKKWKDFTLLDWRS